MSTTSGGRSGQIGGPLVLAVSKPETATESLEAAEQTGRQTLSELEGMLAVLRGADASIGAAADRRDGTDDTGLRTPLPHLSDLPALIEAVRQTGRTVYSYILGIELDGRIYSVEVVPHNAPYVLIGRDILNQMTLIADGPNEVFELVHAQR